MIYIAFLRAINVGKKNPIKKEQLKHYFEDFECTNVKTFLQTGNVKFEYPEDRKHDVDKLQKSLEKKLQEVGTGINVMIDEFGNLKEFVLSNPFGKEKNDETEIWYLTILKQPPSVQTKLPVLDTKKGIRFIKLKNNYLLSIRTKIKGVVGVSPNENAEKYYRLPATTRNWNTILKIVK